MRGAGWLLRWWGWGTIRATGGPGQAIETITLDQLRTIASALLGTVDIVADPSDLAADFRAIMARRWENAWLTWRCDYGHRGEQVCGSSNKWRRQSRKR